MTLEFDKIPTDTELKKRAMKRLAIPKEQFEKILKEL